ncbi:MAG: thioredoxin family protein [Planctomycetaceae bacterium]
MRFVPLWKLVVVLAIAQFATMARAADGWQSDFDAARLEAQRTGKPLLVHFWADWCQPCRQMDSTVFNQPAVIQQLQQNVVGVKINVDQREDLAARFGVESLPCDIFLEPTGERMVESSGYRPLNDYLALLQRAQLRNQELAKAKTQQAARQPAVAGNNAAGGTTQAPTVQTSQQPVPLMLDGSCPVTLAQTRKWEKGSSELRLQYRDQLFQFATPEAKEAFRADPLRYTPRFLGCDPVLVWETDRAVPGQTRYGAFYDDELYLFTTAQNRDRFKSDPDQFIRTRIVLHPQQVESVIR